MAADELGITRKSSSSWFPSQVVEGARSREQHWKSGKPPLTPALDIRQDILQALWPNLKLNYSPSVLKW